MKFLKKRVPAEVVVDNHRVGEMQVADGSVDITDPCYDNSTWCAVFDKKVKMGDYVGFITVVNYPHLIKIEDEAEATIYKGKVGEVKKMDDERIMSLKIVHKDYLDANKRWQLINVSIGVDAGLCGFYNHKPDFEADDAWNEFCDSLQHFGDTCCTCDIKPYGITVSSGFGDGCYRLYAQKDKGEIVALELRFN